MRRTFVFSWSKQIKSSLNCKIASPETKTTDGKWEEAKTERLVLNEVLPGMGAGTQSL